MLLACTLMAAIMTAVIGPTAADDRGSGAGSARSPDEIVDRLRAEAAGVQRGHASELFAALCDPGVVESLRLSKTQVELAARLDQLARDIQGAWLIRGLDEQPRPPNSELADRLGERGKRLRARVVWQAEAIALEGVLEPNQAKRLLGRSGRRLPQRMVAGYREFKVHVVAPTENKGPAQRQVQACIAALANPRYQPSELFGIFLSEGGRVTPALSREQTIFIQRMDMLNRDTAKAFLARGLEPTDLSPTDQHWLDAVPPKMLEGLSEDGRVLRISLLLRSEAIALDGILKPEQLISSKRHLWAARGLNTMDARMGGTPGIIALLDPDVANLLGLAKGQREEVNARIDGMQALVLRLNDEVFSAVMETQNHPNDSRFVADEHAALGAARAQIRQAEGDVRAVLTTRQRRAFERLIKAPKVVQPKTSAAARPEETR
jgi:hypothetical protein